MFSHVMILQNLSWFIVMPIECFLSEIENPSAYTSNSDSWQKCRVVKKKQLLYHYESLINILTTFPLYYPTILKLILDIIRYDLCSLGSGNFLWEKQDFFLTKTINMKCNFPFNVALSRSVTKRKKERNQWLDVEGLREGGVVILCVPWMRMQLGACNSNGGTFCYRGCCYVSACAR